MNLIQYIKDTYIELGHCSWPTKRQAIIFTLITVFVSIFVSIFLGVFDFGFNLLLEKFLLN